MNQSTHDKKELRSERVREILGEIPKGLIRWGTIIICIIFIALLVIVTCLKYPYGNGETIFEYIFHI